MFCDNLVEIVTFMRFVKFWRKVILLQCQPHSSSSSVILLFTRPTYIFQTYVIQKIFSVVRSRRNMTLMP